jgi:hypothetical protein
MKKLFVFTTFVALFAFKATAQHTVPVKSAAKHIGETVIICDKVFSGKLSPSSNTTLLSMGDNPSEELTVMIPAAYRSKFKGNPEIDYIGRDVIIKGKLVNDNGKPRIVVTDPKQLKVVLIDNSRTLFTEKGKIH